MGVKLAQRVAMKTQQDLILYDAKPSYYLKGYWHLAIKPVSQKNEVPVLIYTTNGYFAVPALFNISPEQKRQPLEKETPPAVNLFLREQNGMYIGKPDLKNLFLLLKAKKKTKNFIVISNSLWTDDFYNIIKKIVEAKIDYYDIYLAPFFALSDRDIMQGRHFYALIEYKIPYYKIAMFLSHLDHVWKMNDSNLTHACVSFLIKEKKLSDKDYKKIRDEYVKKLKKITVNDIFKKEQKILQAYGFSIGYMKSFNINGKIFIDSRLLNGYNSDYAKNILYYMVKERIK